MEQLLSLDRSLFLLINGIGNSHPFADNIMMLLSAKWSALPIYALLAYLFYQKLGLAAIPWLALMVIILVVLTDQGSVVFFKEVFERLRPCHEGELLHEVRLVNNHCGGQFGFISSHAANTFGITTFVYFALKPLPANYVWLVIWASLVGISRVYLGVHYPLDVVVGALYGAVIGGSLGLLFTHLFGK